MQWIIDNKEWLFSGIGVFVLSGFVTTLLIRRKQNNKTLKMKLRSDNNSTNIQVAGDWI